MESPYRRDSYLKINLSAFQKAYYTSFLTYYHFPFGHSAVFSLGLGSALHLSSTMGRSLQSCAGLLTQNSGEWDSWTWYCQGNVQLSGIDSSGTSEETSHRSGTAWEGQSEIFLVGAVRSRVLFGCLQMFAALMEILKEKKKEQTVREIQNNIYSAKWVL